ncbi:periplasmic sensor signal transduction histidine kinase [Magnetococcus marinus MC-1]|uniref:histidine kinase n=1 Tax=Magnetococcus marinus (strain ATCC BAA-1437 / JCM 17883 / MC-1) TaxID=156889 RepID=A0LD24_MAGMM|nr:ATP-binding protein [Magnetococcus marinus]ABK45867.1 periplasmic sensor signal transduction histidine kinase [Magnetococcus marinus MC-1]
MRLALLPRTLSGQLLLILMTGISMVLALSAVLHLHERSEALSNYGSIQAAYRLKGVVENLDPLLPQQRQQILGLMESSLQFIQIIAPSSDAVIGDAPSHPMAQQFLQRLQSVFGVGWQIRVKMLQWQGPPETQDVHQRHHRQHMGGMQRIFPDGLSFLAQVQLRDGNWVEFHNHLPKEVFDRPDHLFGALLALFIGVMLLAVVAVRLTTRPLTLLVQAAHGLGEDLNRPPLPVQGCRELRQTAQALNSLQARIKRHVQERTQLLAAISHDLRTPLTRMQLRTERLIEGDVQHAYFQDIKEMEQMIQGAMAFIQGMEQQEPWQRVDLAAMLERLQEEFAEMGYTITLDVPDHLPFWVMRTSLKRALSNLISNGVQYGQRVAVSAIAEGDGVKLSIRDHGPGIPESEFARVLEPFTRLEASRSRHTGGVGLGLAIARNIIQAHGGGLRLHNHPDGGLQVDVMLVAKDPPSPHKPV